MAQDTGKGGTSQGDTRQSKGGEGGAVVTLWYSKAEAADELGVSTRTLLRMVKRGQVERRQVGREARYRIVKCDRKRATLDTRHPRQGDMASVTGGKGGEGGDSEIHELTDVVAEPEYPVLVGLVERLTDRLVELERKNVELERDRAEALAIGHQIADERDQALDLVATAHQALARSNTDVRRLHNAIDTLTDAVVAVCTSPLAVPVRRRLRAALATS